MEWQLLFVSIPPAVAFVAFSRVGTPREAIVGSIVVSGFELLYNSLRLGIVELQLSQIGHHATLSHRSLTDLLDRPPHQQFNVDALNGRQGWSDAAKPKHLRNQ